MDVFNSLLIITKDINLYVCMQIVFFVVCGDCVAYKSMNAFMFLVSRAYLLHILKCELVCL